MRSSVTRLAVLFGCFFFLTIGAQAQTGVYATFSASDFDVPNVSWQYGPTFGLYHDFFHFPFIGAGLDARATLAGFNASEIYSGFAGPTFQLHPAILPIKPYAEVLVGAGHVKVGQGLAATNQTAFSYEGVVGLDWTILPRIDWRVVDFSYQEFTNLSVHATPRTVSTGFVLRLP